MSRIQIFAVALLLAVCSACSASSRGAKSPAGDTSSYQFHLAVARTLLRSEQPRSAIAHVRALQKLQPEEAEPFYLMARAYIQMGAGESAHQMLGQALERDPDMAVAHAARAVLLDRERKHREAENIHRHAIELRPDNPGFHNNLGFNLYLQGRYADAAQAYADALALDAGSRRVHNNLGFARGMLGEIDSAYSHFKLAGTPAEAENNLGLVYEKLGQLTRARERYQAAVTADGSLEVARDNLSRVSERLGLPSGVPNPGVDARTGERIGETPSPKGEKGVVP